MDVLEINPHIVYVDARNAKGVAMNLITFGLRQFMETSLYTRRDQLKNISGTDIAFDLKFNQATIADFAFNGLTDAIKVSICFENFMKTILLLKGYCVHKLNKDRLGELSKEQFKRPISLSEILKVSSWQQNSKIENELLRWQIPGVSNVTIGMKELMSNEYQKVISLPKKVLSICKPLVAYRNNLHYYTGESFDPSVTNARNLKILICFLNQEVVPLQNSIVSDLEKGNEYKISYLTV